MRSLILAAPVMILASGCFLPGFGAYDAPIKPGIALFELYSGPMTTDARGQRLGTKRGSAQTQYIRDPVLTGLPIAAWGDASVARAAQDGGITTVQHVDFKVVNILGVYIAFTTVAYGD
jgi:hypothetical protein